MEIVLATENLHKVREFREMLRNLPGWDVLSLRDFPEYTLPSPPEGSSFEESASFKAKHAAHTLHRWVLADDSGLVVPALGGAPGTQSRTYAGEDATDRENMEKLLQELNGKQDLDRSAYLQCCLALADSSGVQKAVTGYCEGEIVEQPRGSNGFGYDALFRKYDYDKTLAELDENIKIRISHRRKAFDKILLFLETVCPV